MRVLQHTHMVSEPDMTCAEDFSVHICCSALRMKKSLLSLHVQTQYTSPIPPLSCLFPLLCKTNISKDSLVPKQSAAMGGTLNLLAQHSHPTKAGVTRATFLKAITHGALKLLKTGQDCKAIYTNIINKKHTHRNIHSDTPFMWKVFSQSGLQTDLTTMSRSVKPTPGEEVEREEKQSLGNVQTKTFCLPR